MSYWLFELSSDGMEVWRLSEDQLCEKLEAELEAYKDIPYIDGLHGDSDVNSWGSHLPQKYSEAPVIRLLIKGDIVVPKTKEVVIAEAIEFDGIELGRKSL